MRVTHKPSDGRLPLRWGVILTAAIAGAAAMWALVGAAVGVGIGLALVSVLHKILEI